MRPEIARALSDDELERRLRLRRREIAAQRAVPEAVEPTVAAALEREVAALAVEERRRR